MTTTVRSVRVELEMGIAGYVANARIAGHETDKAFGSAEARISATSRAVSRLEKNTANLSATTSRSLAGQASLGREIEKTGTSAGRAERSIDKYSGRLGLLLNVAAGIGPAFVPIGAVVVPAVAGLASQLGFAAAAGGAAVLAMQGVGDSLKAIEKARLEPTVENLRAADEAVRRLAPEAQVLVRHLEDLSSAGRGLQRTAAGGFIPGLDDAITSLETRIPEVRRLIAEVSDAAGDNLRDAGESLASDRWTFFIEYLQSQARPQLDATADSVGNVAHGIAELLVATTGLQGDFGSFLRDSTESFDQWASRLSSSTEFHEFVAYVRENGPEVADTAAAIADAILQIVEAAAPLGGPTLQVLETIADVIGTIADSDIGTPLLTLLSLTSAYRLAATPLKSINESAWGTRQTSNLKGFGAALTTVVTAQDRARMSAAQLVAAEEKRSKAISGGLKTLGKGAAIAGGLALASSGVADKMGLANTATLALAGSMAGPWGAAAGAGVGLLLDWSHRSDGAKEAAAEFTATLDQQTGALTDNSRALAVNKLQDAGALDAAKELGINLGLVTDAALGNEAAQTRLNAALAGYDGLVGARVGREAEAAGAAVTLGNAVDDVSGAVSASQEAFDQQSAAMGGATHHTNELRAAYDQAASAADGLVEELSRLDDFLNNRGTFRAYQASLDALRASIKDAPHAFSEMGEAGRENLGNLDQVLADTKAHLETLKDALGRPDTKARAAFLDSAIATLKEIGKRSPEAAAAVREVLPALQEIKSANKTAVMKADNADVKKKALEAKLALHDVATSRNHATITADSKPLARTVSGAKGMLDDLDGTTAHPHINVDPGNSFQLLGGIRSELSKIVSKTITVTVNRIGAALPHLADGGTVPGPRTPYRDKVLIHAAPGEEIISNSHGQADQFRADRSAGRIPGYADGGTVEDRIRSTHTTRDSSYSGTGFFTVMSHSLAGVTKAADGTAKGLKKLEAAADKVEKSYDREKSKLDDLISQRSSLASSIASAALHDPFGNGLAGLDAQVEADTGDIDAMTAALATLVNNGLDPKSALYQQLAASMDVNTAQQLAALSAGDLASRATRFQHRADEAAVLGGTVAGQEFNEAVRDQTKATRELRETLKDLRAEIREMGDHVKAGAHSGTKEGAKDVGDNVFSAVKDANEGRQRRTTAAVRTGGGSR